MFASACSSASAALRRKPTALRSKNASSRRYTRSRADFPDTTYGSTVGEYGRCASRVATVSVPSPSCMRIALIASSAAWLLPTIRYFVCSVTLSMVRVPSVVLVEPHRLARHRAVEQRLGLGDDAVEVADRDVGAGEPADEAHRRQEASEPVQHAEHFLVHRAAVPAEADRAIDDAERAHAAERVDERVDRERAEGLDLDEADLLAGVARLVDRVLRGAGHAAQRHDREVGVVEPVLLDQRRIAAAEAPR